MEAKEKSKFIGAYLDKKMKNHNMGYGLQYLSKLARHEAAAEKLWDKKIKQNNPSPLK